MSEGSHHSEQSSERGVAPWVRKQRRHRTCIRARRQEEEASRLTQGGEEGGGKDVEIVLVHYNAYLLTCWA